MQCYCQLNVLKESISVLLKKMAKKIEKAKMAYERARALLKAKKLQRSLEMVVHLNQVNVYKFTVSQKQKFFLYFSGHKKRT